MKGWTHCLKEVGLYCECTCESLKFYAGCDIIRFIPQTYHSETEIEFASVRVRKTARIPNFWVGQFDVECLEKVMSVNNFGFGVFLRSIF